MAETEEKFYATGKRKESIARVWLQPGEGTITVNSRKLEDYFGRDSLQRNVRQPLVTTDRLESFDIIATVRGGGLAGQSGAIRLGISRALLETDPGLRTPLKRAGFLTRDSREVERKKYGRPGARKRFQFSKR